MLPSVGKIALLHIVNVITLRVILQCNFAYLLRKSMCNSKLWASKLCSDVVEHRKYNNTMT